MGSNILPLLRKIGIIGNNKEMARGGRIMSAEIHKGDVGTVFQVTLLDGTTVVDISGATTKQILFQKPNGTTMTKNATFVTDGTDGKLKYTTVANDLDTIGLWKIQARVVLPTGSWHSDTGTFRVYKNL